MGTMISLNIGEVAIDWGKNQYFNDHSPLFQSGDVRVETFDIDEGESREVESLTKPLAQVAARLDLLGHSVRSCEAHYIRSCVSDDDGNPIVPFAWLAKALRELDVNQALLSPLPVEFEAQLHDDTDELAHRIIRALPESTDIGPFELSECIDDLGPYGVLRLLAENPGAGELTVEWGFSPLVEQEWAERERFVRPLSNSLMFLIVTEGSSDSKVLQKAFEILRPTERDFFYYIDMHKGYPFTSASGLVQFTKGMASMSVQNSVVVLFDNDAEGHYQFGVCSKLDLPANIRVLKLPDLAELSEIETVGPTGRHPADLNGCGAAIECYLDLGDNPCAHWKSLNNSTGKYQAEIMEKDRIRNQFLDLTARDGRYDFSKISKVVDMIIAACVTMKEDAALDF